MSSNKKLFIGHFFQFKMGGSPEFPVLRGTLRIFFGWKFFIGFCDFLSHILSAWVAKITLPGLLGIILGGHIHWLLMVPGGWNQGVKFDTFSWRFQVCSGMVVWIYMETLNAKSYPDSIGFGRASGWWSSSLVDPIESGKDSVFKVSRDCCRHIKWHSLKNSTQ